jgi:PhnB protein
MSIKSAIPYLNLRGKAVEAIEFYTNALGAKVELLRRFGEEIPDYPAELKDQVMHAELRLGDALVYLSDGGPHESLPSGGVISVAVAFDDADQARAAFDKLGSGGTVFQPIMDAPWGALFGSLQDRYGINWMITTVPASAAR